MVKKMGRRGQHSFEELFAMIVDAAYDIVVRDGFERLSTRKIAAQIGYSVGTLYNVFENLDDIFLHLNSRTLDLIIDKIRGAALSATENPFNAMAHAYSQFSSENYNIWSLLFEYQMPRDYIAPRWYYAKLTEMFDIVTSVFMRHTGLAQQEAQKHVAALWGAVHGVCLLSCRDKYIRAGLNLNPEHMIDLVVDNYVRGVCGPERM